MLVAIHPRHVKWRNVPSLQPCGQQLIKEFKVPQKEKPPSGRKTA